MFSKMPWASGESQHGHEEPEQEESLTTILPSSHDRTELTLLIANCTETMRKVVLDTFDANETGQKSDTVASPQADMQWKDSVKADIEAQAKAKAELDARKKELSSAKMREQKAAALKHFDEWRDSVLLRIGEVVNSKDQVKDVKKEARPQSPRLPPRKVAGAAAHQEDVDKALRELYPATETPLLKLAEEKRTLILHSLLLLLLSLENYSAQSRTLLLHITSSLNLSVRFLAEDESKIARGLLAAAEMKAEEETKKKAEENSSARKWKVGLATVAGAAVIGITGGLAAPLLAAGVGSVMGGLGLGATATAGYLGTLASSSVIVGGLFGAYGGRMTGQMMDQYAREVEDFAFIPVRTNHRPRKIEKEYRRLRVAIGITGWLTEKDEVVEPWRVLGQGLEVFALRYELESLLSLGNSMTTMIKSVAWGYAKKEIIRHTVFSALTAALWPIGLLKVSRIIDNPFSVAKGRADKAGEVLADAIINKAQGERPVTLIGYSLGARVIFICLKKLAERKAFGLIESVVLLGAPTPSTAADWRLIRSVVTGRVVNVYSTNDYILAFLYRSSSIQYGVAGLQPIEGVKGIQNVDVTDMLQGHVSYRYLPGPVLKKIGFEDVDVAQIAKQEAELKTENEKEAADEKAPAANQVSGDSKPAAGLDGKEDLKNAGDMTESQIRDLENQVEQKNRDSMMSWMTEKLQLGGDAAATAAVKAKTWYMTRGTPAAGAAGDAAQKADLKDVQKPAPQPNQEADVVKTEALDAEKQAAAGPQL